MRAKGHSRPETLSTKYVYSAASAGMMVLRDFDTDSNESLDQRVWVMQGPDRSVWTIGEQGGDSNDREDFVYSPEGQVVTLRYAGYSRGNEYSFVPNSSYDWRYYWHGGRAELDQDLSDPPTIVAGSSTRLTTCSTSTARNTTSTRGVPVAQDTYAFYRPDSKLSARSFMNVVMPRNGTQPYWATAEGRLWNTLNNDFAWTGGFFGSIIDPSGYARQYGTVTQPDWIRYTSNAGRIIGSTALSIATGGAAMPQWGLGLPLA